MEHLTAVVDSREQTPWDLSPMTMETNGLNVGELFHSRFGIDRGHREKELGRFRSVLWFGAGAFPEGIGSVERLASIGDRD